MINGTYEEGVRDTIKFLEDNGKIELNNMPTEQLIELLKQLSGRGDKNDN